MDKRIKMIKELASLEENWDSYGAPPIREEAIELAIHLLPHLPPQAWPVPNNDEGVTFEWDEDGKTYSVVCWGMPWTR